MNFPMITIHSACCAVSHHHHHHHHQQLSTIINNYQEDQQQYDQYYQFYQYHFPNTHYGSDEGNLDNLRLPHLALRRSSWRRPRHKRAEAPVAMWHIMGISWDYG